MAGLPRRARLVGRVLQRLDPQAKIPWHRVVNAKGEVSDSLSRNGGDILQRRLLEKEGITFDDKNRLNSQPMPLARLGNRHDDTGDTKFRTGDTAKIRSEPKRYLVPSGAMPLPPNREPVVPWFSSASAPLCSSPLFPSWPF